MKQITINIVNSESPTLTGWLFTYAGLKLVASNVAYINAAWWAVYEFSTGRKVNRNADTTRKATIEITKKELDNHGSINICKAIQAAIDDTGIINYAVNLA